MDPAQRIASAFIAAAKKKEFQEAYLKAMAAFSKGGDVEPMVALAHKALNTIIVNGRVAPWVGGLGSAKIKQVGIVEKVMSAFLDKAEGLKGKGKGDPGFDSAFNVLIMTQPGLKVLDTVETTTEARKPTSVAGFTVLEMPGVNRAEVKGAIEALEKAASLLRPKFPQVLYGDVYLAPSLFKGIAHYNEDQDKVYVNVKAEKHYEDIYVIIHELGHRYDLKFLSAAQRKSFRAISPANPVTPYGAKNAEENFAEGFAAFVLEKPLPLPIGDFFKQL